ncbi:ATP-binding protein [Marivita sp.]|jgi:predicted kinase|uniref:AAA family ATPase n=1 Tax=Marivita sp. TaxID=2003365 RepID=UPI00321B5E82
MAQDEPTLHMFCGKIAAGKSTLAGKLAQHPGTVMIAEDAWLFGLFGDQMSTGADFVRVSGKLRGVLGPHISALLKAGVSVVFDSQANTLDARLWMRSLFEAAGADHRLHVLDAPDEVCLARLRTRNDDGSHPFQVTEAQFHQFTEYYVPPTEAEGFRLVMHKTT